MTTTPATSPALLTATPAAPATPSPETEADADLLAAAWSLDPGVAIRPEPFGALLYHFGTRKLSFVRSREVVRVLRKLDKCDSARAACDVAGVPPELTGVVARSLATLAASGLIHERS